jgi:hypothetical protein
MGPGCVLQLSFYEKYKIAENSTPQSKRKKISTSSVSFELFKNFNVGLAKSEKIQVYLI